MDCDFLIHFLLFLLSVWFELSLFFSLKTTDTVSSHPIPQLIGKYFLLEDIFLEFLDFFNFDQKLSKPAQLSCVTFWRDSSLASPFLGTFTNYLYNFILNFQEYTQKGCMKDSKFIRHLLDACGFRNVPAFNELTASRERQMIKWIIIVLSECG